MSDELYAVFQPNIIKETRQLSTPTLSFDNGKLTIGNIDADAIGFKIYNKTGTEQTAYTLIKTVTFSEITAFFQKTYIFLQLLVYISYQR